MTERTSAGLRDILFDEIDALRKPKGNPHRALAVSALARQIIGTVEAELKFQTATAMLQKAGPNGMELGAMRLGSSSAEQPAASAETAATAA